MTAKLSRFIGKKAVSSVTNRTSPWGRRGNRLAEGMVTVGMTVTGHTMEVVDGLSGEVRSIQIFVAVLGASNYTYAEASLSQSLPDWIASHVRAFAYFGGVTRQTVSDNLKAGITRACFHEPMVNRTYADLARHYRTAIVPARPYRPKDKTIASYCTLF